MGDPYQGATAATAVTLVGWWAGRRALRWSRRRCDEALAAAARMPTRERARVFVAAEHPGMLSRAQACHRRALQQALDDERRDGTLLARRAVPSVWSDEPA